MSTHKMNRRAFTTGLAAAGAGMLAPPLSSAAGSIGYRGPNVIIVRFGGGVRRRETIDAKHSYSPYLRHQLTRRGVLFTDMRIAELQGLDTSHGQGTLHILTGRYKAYQNLSEDLIGEKLQSSVPTLFEYLRKSYAVPRHQALLINGEDRPDEEFFTHGNHRMFGVRYRSEVLSLYRYKTWLMGQQLSEGQGTAEQLAALQKELAKRRADDRLTSENAEPSPEIERFWADWRREYGDDGLRNPRGDRLLTALALRALKTLRPKLLMINYQDPDYVHWGNISHYTRAISIIDQQIMRLVDYTDRAPGYRGRTIFVITPDCGRDSNPLMHIPFQHHFNSRSAHEVWAFFMGPGIAQNRIISRPVDQSAIAATIGGLMRIKARFAEGEALREVDA